ncbi:MAG TPA: FAD-binding oxidoreductase [Fimbriimonadaceae bacterium]|jgi:FAD/FMN-containing dehydrogenase
MTEQAEKLNAQLRGSVVEPGDPTYDEDRKVYNAMINRRPRLIAKCVDVADVIASVRFGRDQGLNVSIRGGGHNAGGLGIWDDALVIDLSGIKFVVVDPISQTVQVGAGCTWGDVDHATHAFGLAVPSGIISTTGVGGLTLGGGTGHLTRKYGLTIDNLISADLVLADGSFVTASADQNEDLFWAIRGGGGNFGVVTSFTFQAHPVETVCAGIMFWEMSEASDILKWYREFITQATEDISGFYAFHTVPPAPPFPEELHFKKVCGIVWCYLGDQEGFDAVLAPLRSFRKPIFDFAGPMPYPAVQGLFDGLYPAGLQWYWKGDFFKTLNDDAVALHVKHGLELPTLHSAMHLYPVNGAVHRVDEKATAWSYRDVTWNAVFVGVDPDPANRDKITKWARDYFDDLHPHGAGGGYVNFMMDGEGDERVRATYRGNYERLAQIKAKYDPENFFHVNQNIKPKRA